MKLQSGKEAVLNRENLLRIKAFILRNGETRIYSQMYNDNPAFETERFAFYLNPDPGGPHDHPQWNINCDPERGDFHTLVIRRDITGDISAEEFRWHMAWHSSTAALPPRRR